jgi:hypothetical protein
MDRFPVHQNLTYDPTITIKRMRIVSKHLILITFFLWLPILGCSDGDGRLLPSVAQPPAAPPAPPPSPPVPAADVAGTWFSRTANNAVNCGAGEFIDGQTLVVTQDDSVITLLTSTGNTFSGTVNGDLLEWTGNFEERGGTTTFTSLSATVSGNSVSGNATWTWTDGTDSCNGTMEITASRDWGVAESDSNSRPPNSFDLLEFTDGVAFVTGTALTTNDEDYFLLVLATDATIQAELSHFDVQTSNLDLEILDENLIQVTLSDSADAFEKVEAQLQAGVTYYIGMLPTSITDAESYILSVDVN